MRFLVLRREIERLLEWAGGHLVGRAADLLGA
jgi:hypothetical protein